MKLNLLPKGPENLTLKLKISITLYKHYINVLLENLIFENYIAVDDKLEIEGEFSEDRKVA